MSEDTKIKISLKKKGGNHKSSKNPMSGKNHTDKTKLKMSINKIGFNNPMYGTHHTIETKQKLSLRTLGVNVKIYDKLDNLIKEFPTIKSTAKYFGVRSETIRKIFDTGVSNNEFIYKFELRDKRIWIYNYDKELIEIVDSAKKLSKKYNIPKSTLSYYIKWGKLYKNKFYFYKLNSKNNP